MEKTENLKREGTFKQTWFLLGLYIVIPLFIISMSIFRAYQLENLLTDNLNRRVSVISQEGLGSINNLHFFSWLTLIFLLILIVLSIPVVQKRLKIRDLLYKKLDQAKVEKEERIRQLEELNTFIKDLYDHSPIGFHSTDSDGLIIEINQTQLDWLGYARDQVVGKMKFMDFVAPDLKAQVQKNALRLRKTGFINGLESVLRKKTGEEFPILINSKAAYDGEGHYLHSRTVVFDFSERKKVEEAVEQSRNELNRLGLLKSQFIANMSHEIRTPLNAILGFSNLLDRTQLNKNQAEFVKNIKSSSENLLTIINDILDFSKIEAGALRLESIPFNLDALLHSLENMFRYRADEKRLIFEVKCDQDLPGSLLGDPTRLTQILVNLLSNAFKFTKQGSVSLTVDYTTHGEQGVTIQFKVKDTGIGIPADQLEQIFERFGQASSETTRVYGGTGLGLTISRQLAELQKASLKVASEEGMGSTFTLEIPYQISDVIAPTTTLDGEWFQDGLAKNVSILIVEDNPMNQRIVELLLEDWGFQYEHAENGKLALEMLRKKVYDIVLMDIQMPVMDGYTATEKIRQELNLLVPIIATTAHAFAGEREKCISYGMNDYISKPIREQELLALIKRYLPNYKQKQLIAEIHPKSGDIRGFDHQYVQEVSRGKPERLQEMAKLFLTQSTKELTLLAKSIYDKNLTEAASLAHSMKSTVSYMGFGVSLGNLLKELELKVGADVINTVELQSLLTTIELETEKAQAFVQEEFL